MDYQSQFGSDICFIKRVNSICADTLPQRIKSLLLDPWMEYLSFVEEQMKDQHLQLFILNNFSSLKLMKIHVLNVNLEVVCDTSTGQLCLFIPESLWCDFFFILHNLSQLVLMSPSS